ncbi:permease [Mangrovibacillus cuniculi]|uniref:Permease n=1 Tax=Mangrovibacillus cuniculi TaxID=2593652 RepID=A0A7S8C9Y2_9BACI|nr:permease [Mangrovibacillus cuniculi]QPC45913.1 permease [Mangrovibacillus cuniculi]
MWGEIGETFFYLALELSTLFIIISFAIHALQSFIPYEKIERFLSGRNRGIAATGAIVFAFVTPFCSCSTIPLIVNMLKKKMPFGIVMIFLFASPVLDPTIITLMGVILGWKVALLYTILTILFSVVLGFMLEALGLEKSVKNVVLMGYVEREKRFEWRAAWNETIGLMKSVLPYLLIGAAVGVIIQGAVPTVWIATTFGKDSWWLVPVAAVIGIPLYIRLASMIPISQILIMKGMALGPVMALMIASAGASLPEVILLKSIFRVNLVIIFVSSVITMATLSGFIFYIFG